MVKRTISFTLDDASITKAVSEVNRFKGDFLRGCNEVIQKLVIEGQGRAKFLVVAHGAIDTGELVNSVGGLFNAATRTGIVYADAAYAAFVEYGTGVVGSMESHPEPNGWVYDIHNHGFNGWYYYDHGKRHWSCGMPSRPFMYQTKQWLMSVAPGIASQIFSGL